MARRKNINRDNFRSEKVKKDLKRKEKHLNQKLLVIIACEDSKSSRYYFDALFQLLKSECALSRESCVFATHQHTNPTGVLTDLKNFRSSMGKTYRDYEHRWIVIDRDKERCGGGGHTVEDFNNALTQATRSSPKVKVAWSNPCFEIWYLLHYQYYCTGIDRDRLIEKLSEQMGSSYKKNDPNIYNILRTKLAEALRNANRLQQHVSNESLTPDDANPGTTVHELVGLFQGLLAK